MKRFALAGSILVAMSCLWVAGSGRGDPPPVPAGQPAAGKPFLEVGKTYTFEFGGPLGTQTAEVVEAPRDNWVKVTGKGQGRDKATLWINLTQVRMVQLIESK